MTAMNHSEAKLSPAWLIEIQNKINALFKGDRIHEPRLFQLNQLFLFYEQQLAVKVPDNDIAAKLQQDIDVEQFMLELERVCKKFKDRGREVGKLIREHKIRLAAEKKAWLKANEKQIRSWKRKNRDQRSLLDQHKLIRLAKMKIQAELVKARREYINYLNNDILKKYFLGIQADKILHANYQMKQEKEAAKQALAAWKVKGKKLQDMRKIGFFTNAFSIKDKAEVKMILRNFLVAKDKLISEYSRRIRAVKIARRRSHANLTLFGTPSVQRQPLAIPLHTATLPPAIDEITLLAEKVNLHNDRFIQQLAALRLRFEKESNALDRMMLRFESDPRMFNGDTISIMAKKESYDVLRKIIYQVVEEVSQAMRHNGSDVNGKIQQIAEKINARMERSELDFSNIPGHQLTELYNLLGSAYVANGVQAEVRKSAENRGISSRLFSEGKSVRTGSEAELASPGELDVPRNKSSGS